MYEVALKKDPYNEISRLSLIYTKIKLGKSKEAIYNLEFLRDDLIRNNKLIKNEEINSLICPK